jgi:membrane-associated phospholipid phosphatase
MTRPFMAVQPRPTGVLARRVGWLTAGREVLIIAASVVAYFTVRGWTEGAYETAASNARSLIELERALGLYREPWLQSGIVGHRWAVNLMNWVYMWGHWPVIFLAACWLFVRRPRTYYLLRNAFLLSGGIGLIVFATFPVAPPRLVSAEFTDTITLHSRSYRVLQPPQFVNQFAAMPSLHFGWDLLIGGAIAREARPILVRVVGGALPVLMAAAVVLTANHFILDVAAGMALALAALWVSAHVSLRAGFQKLRSAAVQGGP